MFLVHPTLTDDEIAKTCEVRLQGSSEHLALMSPTTPVYPVITIAPNQFADIEQLGSKDKFWFWLAMKWLFKEARVIPTPQGDVATGGGLGEKIAAEIARLLRIPPESNHDEDAEVYLNGVLALQLLGLHHRVRDRAAHAERQGCPQNRRQHHRRPLPPDRRWPVHRRGLGDGPVTTVTQRILSKNP